jgi:hypothetical protein
MARVELRLIEATDDGRLRVPDRRFSTSAPISSASGSASTSSSTNGHACAPTPIRSPNVSSLCSKPRSSARLARPHRRPAQRPAEQSLPASCARDHIVVARSATPSPTRSTGGSELVAIAPDAAPHPS